MSKIFKISIPSDAEYDTKDWFHIYPSKKEALIQANFIAEVDYKENKPKVIYLSLSKRKKMTPEQITQLIYYSPDIVVEQLESYYHGA